jgi:hypothetical protein
LSLFPILSFTLVALFPVFDFNLGPLARLLVPLTYSIICGGTCFILKRKFLRLSEKRVLVLTYSLLEYISKLIKVHKYHRILVHRLSPKNILSHSSLIKTSCIQPKNTLFTVKSYQNNHKKRRQSFIIVFAC